MTAHELHMKERPFKRHNLPKTHANQKGNCNRTQKNKQRPANYPAITRGSKQTPGKSPSNYTECTKTKNAQLTTGQLHPYDKSKCVGNVLMMM